MQFFAACTIALVAVQERVDASWLLLQALPLAPPARRQLVAAAVRVGATEGHAVELSKVSRQVPRLWVAKGSRFWARNEGMDASARAAPAPRSPPMQVRMAAPKRPRMNGNLRGKRLGEVCLATRSGLPEPLWQAALALKEPSLVELWASEVPRLRRDKGLASMTLSLLSKHQRPELVGQLLQLLHLGSTAFCLLRAEQAEKA